MGARLIRAGAKGSVWLTAKCERPWKELHRQKGELATRQQTQLNRYTGVFCDDGSQALIPEMFRREGQFPDGRGNKIAVYAFKPFKWRLYGIITDIAEMPGFVGLGVDPSKKQDKADQDLLKQVAKDAGGFLADLRESMNEQAGEQEKGRNSRRRRSGD
ncbi:hypothetical protein [Xanthobacter versatilis]|uniref:hypothetical protein n=1 Tax=Xanthobacter autotrophicus (strain ATCC BAA-1158 / Py2) TaxID=78245 RepID=UPI00372AA07B